MKGSLNLGKILGIPIRLHVSWFLIAILITWTLAAGYFPQEYPGWSAATYRLIGALTSVFFFASVLIHELGQSVLALREKVLVMDNGSFLGMITRERLLHDIRLRAELGV